MAHAGSKRTTKTNRVGTSTAWEPKRACATWHLHQADQLPTAELPRPRVLLPSQRRNGNAGNCDDGCGGAHAHHPVLHDFMFTRLQQRLGLPELGVHLRLGEQVWGNNKG